MPLSRHLKVLLYTVFKEREATCVRAIERTNASNREETFVPSRLNSAGETLHSSFQPYDRGDR